MRASTPNSSANRNRKLLAQAIAEFVSFMIDEQPKEFKPIRDIVNALGFGDVWAYISVADFKAQIDDARVEFDGEYARFAQEDE